MRLSLFTALFLLTLASYAQQPIHLIPQPVSVQTQAGYFVLNKATAITYSKPESATLAALLAQQLADQISFTLTNKVATVAPANAIFLVLNSVPDARLGREGYRLSSSPKGITILANQSAGLFYGVQTLLQLLPVERIQTGLSKTATIVIPAVQIVDYPRFGWRGVMLDVSRSFFPKADVMRYIDELAQFKINTLHWHLT
ncbi:MAG: beta-N-acetylhexosaminidase, partial [Cytophagaceae bacterium]